MILVTVGTHYQQFDRLVKGVDHLAADLSETVIIQRGSTNYLPQNAEHFRWTSSRQMETLTCEARLVIYQASAGAIICTMKNSKPLILVPRFKRYGENHDDHQVQLAREFDNRGWAVIVEDPEPSSLKEAINKVVYHTYPSPGANNLQKALKDQLEDWLCESTIMNRQTG